MFGYCPLASGSRGNSVLLKSKKTVLLIDAGIGYKELLQRLLSIKVDFKEIDAILITHEHRDHIDGLKTIFKSNKNVPIFSNLETAKAIYNYHQDLFKFKIFTTDEPFIFKDIQIKPFSISHDAIEPVGFSIYIENIKLGFCTDLGFVTSLVRKNLENSNFLYVESNHEENMVLSSKRPQLLKQRILGRQGHLSNNNCCDLIKSVLHEDLRHIYLSHMSQECNNKDLAIKKMREILKNDKIGLQAAFQEKASDFVFF